MKQPKVIPFADWAPDAPDLSDYAQEILNVYPAESGAYRPFKAFQGLGVMLGETPLAAYVHRLPDGDAALYVGTATAIYQWSGAEWVPRGSGFNAARWSFESYDDYVYAVNEVDGLWRAQRNEAFTRVEDAPPARYVRRLGLFLFLGYLDNGPSIVRWSALNDPTSWAPNSLTQAGGEVLPTGLGAITGFGDEQYPSIFQERGVTRGTYVGGATIWRLVRSEEERGVISGDSIQSIGQRVFCWTQDGPSVWDGQNLRPLGDGRFRRWARDLISSNDAVALQSSLDRANNAVLWACCTGSTMSGMLWRFGEAQAGGQRGARFEAASDVTVLVDAAPAVLSGADGDPIRGSEIIDQLAGVTSAGELGAFNGANLEAVFETGEFQTAPDRRQKLTELWPVIDAPAQTVFGAIRNRAQTPGDAAVLSAEFSAGRDGMIPCRTSARVNSARIRIPAGAGWTHAQGVQTNLRPASRR